MHSTVTLHTKHKFLPLAHKWKASHPNQGHLEWSGYPEPEEPEEDADGLEKVTVSFEEPEEAAVDWIGVCFYRIKRTIISTEQ